MQENQELLSPAKDEGEALQALNGRSSRKIDLNGQWKFAYYKDEDELTAYGSRHPADIPDGEMGKIPVPSCWQIYGYGTNAYVNLRYPFPCDPPFLPDEDACGLYRRTFAIKGNGFRSFLNFEGVDSCLYVWINGSFVGYSQVSHSTSEFEISPFVHAGENRIDVLVFRWCVGSYLEDQDKLRMSGIFRDVYILRRPLRFIEDFFVHTELSEDLKSATLSVDIHCDGPDMPVRYRFVDENDLEVANGETKSNRVRNSARSYFQSAIPFCGAQKNHGSIRFSWIRNTRASHKWSVSERLRSRKARCF